MDELLISTPVKDWELTFGLWSSPPSATEQQRCDNAVSVIRNAIDRSPALKSRGVKVFTKGSHRNRVNVRRDSDVDVGVMCHDYFLSHYPPGMKDADFGNFTVSDYGYARFKDELEEALVAYLGRDAVTRGNKAFDVHATSYHVEADVVPLFEFRNFTKEGYYLCGTALLPDDGTPPRIINYPERLLESWPDIPLHYENGVAKNTATGRSFKGVVRILKCLRNQMEAEGHASARPIPSYLLECLAWNIPNHHFAHSTWTDIIQSVLSYLWSNTSVQAKCDEWTEVDGFKYLFRLSQPWTRDQAHTFIDAAWNYVGVTP